MLRFQLPADLKHRDIALRAVSAACKLVEKREATADEKSQFRDEVVSAFGEAFNNVVLHAYEGAPEPGILEIDIDIDGDALAITITDHGHPFDLDSVPTPDLDALPEAGLGLFIMRSFMDQVVYKPGPPNVLRMCKRRPQSSQDQGDGRGPQP